MQKNDWDIAHEWFSGTIGGFLSLGDDEYPARGKVTGTTDDGVEILRFNGGRAHDEGGESIEVSIVKYQNGYIELSRSSYATDCDGPLDRHWDGKIKNGEVVEVGYSQRDHYAERMGY